MSTPTTANVQLATPDQLRAAKTYASTGLLSGRATDIEPVETTRMRLSTVLPAKPEQVFRFCLDKRTFPAIMPDPVTTLWTSTEHGELAGTYDFRWWFNRVTPIRWTAFIDRWEEGREFSDLQIRGLFRYFHHTHTCDPHPRGCRYTDSIVFRSPLGTRADRLVIRPQMRRMFLVRQRRMALMLGAMAQ